MCTAGFAIIVAIYKRAVQAPHIPISQITPFRRHRCLDVLGHCGGPAATGVCSGQCVS